MQARWPIGASVVIAPVLLALLLFEALRPFTPFTSVDLQKLGSGLQADGYPRSVLLYVTFIVVQIFLTLGVTGYAFWLIAQTSSASRPRAFGFAISLSALMCVGFVLANAIDLTAYQYTYRTYTSIYASEGASAFWMTPILGGPTAIDLAIIAPSWTGVVAVIFVGVAGQALVDDSLPKDREEVKADKKEVERVVQTLQTLMYGLGAVLVSSAIGAGMFFHLPTQFYSAHGGVDENLLRQFILYADDLTLFWGTIFTFTFIAAVGAPLAAVYMRTFRRDRDSEEASGLRIFSVSALFERIGVMFSPMLTALAAKVFGLFQLGSLIGS